MPAAQSSNQTSDRAISVELLRIVLTACKAAFFYQPLGEVENGAVPAENIAPEEGWSLNMGTLYGMAEEPKSSSDLIARVHADDRDRLMRLPIDFISGKTTHEDCEYRISRIDGEARWLLTRFLLGAMMLVSRYILPA